MIVIPSFATARDVILLAPGWRRGAVLQVERQLVLPGGKPLNVARFLGAMGIPSRLVLLADGPIAAQTAAILPPRVSADLFVTEEPCRTDVAIVDGQGGLTVLNGPPPVLRDAELADALQAVRAALGERDVLVVAGSQPAGLVGRLMELADASAARVLVDVAGDDLREALGRRPAMVKVNASELATTCRSTVVRAWRSAPSLAPGATAIVVTHGRHGLRAWLEDASVVRVPAPDVTVVNPLGAGDAVTAAMAATLDRATDPLDGLRDATAWAATVVGAFGLDLDPGRAAGLRPDVHLVREGTWEPGHDRTMSEGGDR